MNFSPSILNWTAFLSFQFPDTSPTSYKLNELLLSRSSTNNVNLYFQVPFSLPLLKGEVSWGFNIFC